uniref:BTB domain-containing protein n=1 Tax=Esox lucius TaxID=8010 RepID=A0A6Q2YRZ0_ESOLU
MFFYLSSDSFYTCMEASAFNIPHLSELCVSEAHGQQLLSMLRSFRERGLLFDFTITVQGQKFPCHRCVLAACSDFFRAMFEVDMRECGDGMVTLSNQSPDAVRYFLDFCYSGKIVITQENIDMLFQLASFLQVSVLSRACSDFLVGTLELSNCLTLLALAEGYGSASLLQRATDFVVQNFYDLSMTPDFLDMSVATLEVCLESDDLGVPSEEMAVRSMLKWIAHDLWTRQALLSRLLTLLRLHHVPTPTLQVLARTDDLLSGDKLCVCLISDALSRQTQLSGLLPDARPATTHSYIYVHKTEENGETYHAFCYCLDTDQWRELPQDQGVGTSVIPDPPGSSVTSYAEKLFVTGGCRGNCCRTVRLHVAEPFHDATAEVWCYCPITHSCTPAPNMGKPRTMHSAVTTLGRLYVIGGRTRGEREGGLVEVRMKILSVALYCKETSVCGSVIYALGSSVEISDSFNPLLDCFLRYDAVLDQWSRLVAEFGQFFHATLVKAVSVNHTLHLCDLSTYKVYKFCPETCVWQGEGSFECAGFNAGAVGVANRIYILGGDYSPDEITDEVQVYHSGQGQWEEVMPMPHPLTEFHCQVISFNRYRDPWGGQDT